MCFGVEGSGAEGVGIVCTNIQKNVWPAPLGHKTWLEKLLLLVIPDRHTIFKLADMWVDSTHARTKNHENPTPRDPTAGEAICLCGSFKDSWVFMSAVAICHQKSKPSRHLRGLLTPLRTLDPPVMSNGFVPTVGRKRHP